jgi:hypothetical protein
MSLWEIIAVRYEKGYNVEFCTNNAADIQIVATMGGGVNLKV